MTYKVWVRLAPGFSKVVLETRFKRTANTEAREWRRRGFIALVRFTKELVA